MHIVGPAEITKEKAMTDITNAKILILATNGLSSPNWKNP